jgi:hypothetical protein
MMNARCEKLLFTPLDVNLLARPHQIEIHPPPFPASSEKIKEHMVLRMSGIEGKSEEA